MRNKIRNIFLELLKSRGFNLHRTPSPYHLSLDYPVSTRPRYTKSKPHSGIENSIIANCAAYEMELAEITRRTDLFATIGADASDTYSPNWMNEWLHALDAAALMHFLLKHKPARYTEIGSGNSTKFARRAVEFGRLSTTITSIDPHPRAEINNICDHVIRKPLEQTSLSFFDDLCPGDILFFDGSHRVFMNSDVIVFFLEVIPRLKPGVLIHVHDIFWPADYPPEWGERYYSEQYMLGMLLLFGPYRTVLPNAFIANDRQLSGALDVLPKSLNRWPTSYWITSLPADSVGGL